MVLVEVERDLPAEAVEEQDGLAPGRIDLSPVHGHRGQATQSTDKAALLFKLKRRTEIIGICMITCTVGSLLKYI